MVFAFSAGKAHEINSQTVQNVHTEDSKISFIPMFYLLDEVATQEFLFQEEQNMRIPYGFTLTNSGGLETNKSEAENVALIFILKSN